MSNAIFPALPGLTWAVVKRRISSTIVVQNASGKEVRVPQWQDPIYEFEFTYELLRDDPTAGAFLIAGFTEFMSLVGFINARQGSFDSFLYLDPNDNTATGESCMPATGDGSNKLFQLARQVGGNGYSEKIQNTVGAPGIYLAGTLQSSGYTVSDTGLVTFTTAPPSGHAVQWSGNFYFRCRFSDDSQDFVNFTARMWNTSNAIKFRSVKL